MAENFEGDLDLSYLAAAATKYGTMYLSEEFASFINNLDPVQLTELAAVYSEIARREDALRIGQWVRDSYRVHTRRAPNVRKLRASIPQLFALFEFLAAAGIAPFNTRQVKYIEPQPKPNWDHLPTQLRYLIEPAEKFGVYYSEASAIDFLSKASSADLAILTECARQISVNKHLDQIEQWLSEYPVLQHGEASLIAGLLRVFDHAGLQLEPPKGHQ